VVLGGGGGEVMLLDSSLYFYSAILGFDEQHSHWFW
jgi:hypothetical protein